MNNEHIEVLKATETGIFTNYIYKAIPLAFDESMSYYETLCALLNYLQNTIIPTVNNNADAVIELQNNVDEFEENITQQQNDYEEHITELFNELQSYVDNYFDNLDVQQEINNKLDEMAEDGTLTNLIKDYVDPIYEEYENQINGEFNTFKTNINNEINTIETKVDQLSSASPLIASDVSEMTDTDRIYVNTTDGKWYYYDGDSWEIGGTYQATQIADDSVNYKKTNFLTMGTNLFNKNTVTRGKYVSYTNGNIYDNAQSCVSDYIIVDGLTHVISTASNQCAFYDVDYEFISGYNDDESDVPANAYYLRVTVPNSDNRLNDYQLNSGDTLLPYENYKYKLDGLNIKKSQITFDEFIDKDETNFIEYSNNLIDYNDVIDGKFISYNNGVEADNSNFIATKFIRLKENETNITISPYNDNIGYQGAFYNENKIYISGIHQNATTSIPTNAKYVRISLPKNYIDKTIMYYGNETGREYEPYNNYLYKTNNKIFYVGSNREIKTLKEGIEKATLYNNATVYVDEGVYNLVDEFGATYLENNNSDKGLILKNGIHIIFDSNAFVTFNYTGNNSYIHQEFSPFNTGMYGFTIENLNLVCSNCRYCVHDERGGSTERYINKYINCKMSLDNSQNPDWSNPQNIGAGLGEKGYIIVDGCHFNNWCTWHNNNNTGYLNSASKVVIKNNYFDNGFIYATDDNKTAFTNPSLFYVYNNCKKGDIVTTEGNTNIIVKDWNNIQHD